MAQQPYDLSDTSGIAKELASEAVTDVKDAIEDTAERFRYEKYLLEHSPGLGGRISQFTRERPIEAVLITMGAAFVIGSLWKFR